MIPSVIVAGKSDPFVQIVLVPEENFSGVTNNLSTKVVNEELYPLFEETFKMCVIYLVYKNQEKCDRCIHPIFFIRKLPKEMMNSSGAFLRLVVYDHDFLRKNEFLGGNFFVLH